MYLIFHFVKLENRKGNFLNQWQEKQNVLAKATCQ